MHPIPFRLPLVLCALAAALLVSACGGGGATPPATATGSSGFAIDDYLSGATVLCDSNGNGLADAGEASKTTDSSGFFRFDPACGAALVVTGGTNIDTGLPFTGTLKAPQGAAVVTPLTTLVAAGMSMAQVNAALGLPAGTDLLNTDPARRLAGALVNGDLMKKSLVLQQLAQKMTEVLAGLASSGGDAARPAIFAEVMSAFAAQLQGGTALVTGATLDQGVIAGLVKAATQRVAAAQQGDSSAVLAAEVRSGAAGINPDSLAQVLAGGMKLQAQAILQASDADVTAATRTAQMDTQITTFVLANMARLAQAPGSDTTALGSTLADQVASSLEGGTPPPTGTVLVSFDEAEPAFTGMGAYGGALPTVEAGPANGSGNALRILKPAAPDTWGGVFFGVQPIAFAADRKTITARVNATRAGAVIKFKVESGNGGPAVEVASSPTGAANTWETVSWTFSGVDVSKSYTVIAITPDAERVTDGQSYYIDDITLAPAQVVVVTPPTTPALVSFDEAEPAFTGMGAYGGALPTVEAGPANGSGNALRILKPAAPNTWGGVFFGVQPIAFAADRKTITARVNATRAGAVIKFKVESGNGGPAVEVASSPTGAANTWETVSWTFSGVDVSKSYTVIAITPDAERVTDGQSYYIDDITLAPAAGGGGGSAGPLTFSSGFSASSRTAEGGEFGGFSGSNQDSFGCNSPDRCGQGGTFSGDAASGFYYYYQTPTPATDLFAGIYIQPAGVTGGLSGSADTAGVQIGSQTMLKFKFGQNPEWFASATNNFMIVMDLGKLYTAGGNACHLQLRRVVTPTSAAVADYAIALSSFALVQDCAGAVTSVAQALAASPISQVAFQAAGGGIALSDGARTSGANLSVAVGGLYPTTLVVNGAITFE